MGREDEIRLIAYSIWEQEGRCDGRDCEHWLKAEVIWEENQNNRTASKAKASQKKQATRQGTKKATGAKKR